MAITKINNIVASWLDDQIYRRLVKNASWLTGGSFIAALLGLASIALTARSLGAHAFGILTLIMVYAGIVDRLLNFQSWQFLIKNGADALNQNDSDRLRAQIKFSALLDLTSSIASALVAIGCASIAGTLLDWSTQERILAMVYSLTILFNLSGMPTGVLRLFDRFQTLAAQKVVTSGLNLVGVAAAWIMDGELIHYLLAFTLSNIAGNMYLLFAAWKQLQHQEINHVWSAPLNGITRREPKLWQFVFYTNIESSIKIIRDLDVFLIKIILSAEAVGLYTLARRLAEALHIIIDPFFYAIYPEFSKLIAQRNKSSLYRLMLKSSLSVGTVAAAIWLGFILLGPWFIEIIFGLSFTEVYSLATACMMASVVWAFAQPISPILYNLGYARDVFAIHASTAVMYLLLLVAFSKEFGVMGATYAYIIFFIAWSMITAIITRQRLKTHNLDS